MGQIIKTSKASKESLKPKDAFIQSENVRERNGNDKASPRMAPFAAKGIG